MTPFLLALRNRKPKEIERRKDQRCRGRCLANGKLSRGFSFRRKRQEQTSDPARDRKREQQKTLVGSPFRMRQKYGEAQQRLDPYSQQSGNCWAAHLEPLIRLRIKLLALPPIPRTFTSAQFNVNLRGRFGMKSRSQSGSLTS